MVFDSFIEGAVYLGAPLSDTRRSVMAGSATLTRSVCVTPLRGAPS